MRFTSPDPAAAQFWNLNHYAGNNPGRFQDPDGLDYADIWNHLKEGDVLGAGKAYMQDVKGVTAESAQNAAAGMLYGTANFLTMGAYGMMVSPEDFAASIGADANSRAFQNMSIATEVVGTVAMVAVTGGASLVMGGARLAGRIAITGAKLAKAGAGLARAAGGQLIKQAAKAIARRAIRVVSKTLEPAFTRIGKMQLARAPRGVPLSFSDKIKRLFLSPLKRHPGVSYSPVGKVASKYAELDQHHVFIQRCWFKPGSPHQWYPNNPAAQLGLQRVGNAGLNLMPIPRRLNQALGRSPLGTAAFGTGVVGVAATPGAVAAYRYWRSDD